MTPLPATNLRRNYGTWAVPDRHLPAVAAQMLSRLPHEQFDPDFKGQYLQTTYFDTPGFDLRKARVKRNRYLTLRLRCYTPVTGAGGLVAKSVYAVSVKTEDVKQRFEVEPALAEVLLQSGDTADSSMDLWASILPPDILARLLEITSNTIVQPIVTVRANRYAAENDTERLTLDVAVKTDTAKRLPYGVLEYKSIKNADSPTWPIELLELRPIKISKFLWATAQG
jgi:hypothetical protein